MKSNICFSFVCFFFLFFSYSNYRYLLYWHSFNYLPLFILRWKFSLVARCSLLLAHYSLLFPRCSLLFARCSFLIARCSLLFSLLNMFLSAEVFSQAATQRNSEKQPYLHLQEFSRSMTKLLHSKRVVPDSVFNEVTGLQPAALL